MKRNFLPLLGILLISIPITIEAQELQSFTEPYRHVAISAPEAAIIAEVAVAEGEKVSQGQTLVQLDDKVLRTALAVADAARTASGSRNAAQMEVELRENQVASYRELNRNGNATPRELQRSEFDLIQAQSRLQSIDEELNVRRLEFERVRTQLAQRKIESPIAGVVAEISKEVGEFVSPNDPVVMHVVQIDQLKAIFSVPLVLKKDLVVGEPVTLQAGDEPIEGIVEFVSPIADAESGSVRVRIRIPNSDGKHQSGVPIQWIFEGGNRSSKAIAAGNARGFLDQ